METLQEISRGEVVPSLLNKKRLNQADQRFLAAWFILRHLKTFFPKEPCLSWYRAVVLPQGDARSRVKEDVPGFEIGPRMVSDLNQILDVLFNSSSRYWIEPAKHYVEAPSTSPVFMVSLTVYENLTSVNSFYRKLIVEGYVSSRVGINSIPIDIPTEGKDGPVEFFLTPVRGRIGGRELSEIDPEATLVPDADLYRATITVQSKDPDFSFYRSITKFASSSIPVYTWFSRVKY